MLQAAVPVLTSRCHMSRNQSDPYFSSVSPTSEKYLGFILNGTVLSGHPTHSFPSAAVKEFFLFHLFRFFYYVAVYAAGNV